MSHRGGAGGGGSRGIIALEFRGGRMARRVQTW